MKIIAFDIDGTLVNTSLAWMTAMNETLTKRGLRHISEENYTTFSSLTLETWMDDVIDHIGGVPDSESFTLDYLNNHSKIIQKIKPQLYDGIKDVLKELQQICIITNRPINAYVKEIEPLLSDIPFDFIKCRDASLNNGLHKGIAKPDPEFIDEVLAHFNCNPHDITYIGDVYEDYVFCENTGMDFIHAAWGYDNKGRLSSISNIKRAKSPKDLLKII